MIGNIQGNKVHHFESPQISMATPKEWKEPLRDVFEAMLFFKAGNTLRKKKKKKKKGGGGS